MQKAKGFTIIELMVVVGIIALFSIILISNFGQARLQLSLSRVAYAFEQNAKQAQSMSLSSLQYTDSNGVSHPIAGYGIYVDLSQDTKYIMYADKSPGNQQYDTNDYVVQMTDFSITDPGIIIKEIDNVGTTTASINFSPPSPLTTITPAPTGGAIDVVFAIASDTSKTETVSINTDGLIQVGASGSSGSIICTTNSNCGTNGFTGSPFCQGNNVYQNYTTYTCNNPGTTNSSCTNSSSGQLQQACTGTCSNGSCNNTITCTTNSNCGTNGFTGSAFCQGNSVYQNYTTYTCNNPGMTNSYCSNASNPQLQQTCPGTCSGGSCVSVACNTNADCGPSGPTGTPFCQGNSVYQNYITYTCNNPGTPSAYCSNTTNGQWQQTCGTNYVCSGGVCDYVACTQDSDCGTDGYTGNPYCTSIGDIDVYQKYTTYTCNNPSTPSAYCSNSSTGRVKQVCTPPKGCVGDGPGGAGADCGGRAD